MSVAAVAGAFNADFQSALAGPSKIIFHPLSTDASFSNMPLYDEAFAPHADLEARMCYKRVQDVNKIFVRRPQLDFIVVQCLCADCLGYVRTVLLILHTVSYFRQFHVCLYLISGVGP